MHPSADTSNKIEAGRGTGAPVVLLDIMPSPEVTEMPNLSLPSLSAEIRSS